MIEITRLEQLSEQRLNIDYVFWRLNERIPGWRLA
jgi:hypothetical protein